MDGEQHGSEGILDDNLRLGYESVVNLNVRLELLAEPAPAPPAAKRSVHGAC